MKYVIDIILNKFWERQFDRNTASNQLLALFKEEWLRMLDKVEITNSKPYIDELRALIESDINL